MSTVVPAEAVKTKGVSPKLVAAVVTAILTYLLTQPVLELPNWASVLIQAVLMAAAVFQAGPGKVVIPADDISGPTATVR